METKSSHAHGTWSVCLSVRHQIAEFIEFSVCKVRSRPGVPFRTNEGGRAPDGVPQGQYYHVPSTDGRVSRTIQQDSDYNAHQDGRERRPQVG